MAKANRVSITPRRTAPARKTLSPPQPIRALTLFQTLPPGHQTFRVPDDGSAPHLKECEFAVIDTTDFELQHGELFLIQYSLGERNRQIIQTTENLCNIGGGTEEPVWWAGDLAGFRQISERQYGVRTFAGLSGGPYLAAHLQAKLIGRVVGFAAQSFGEVLAPRLGWANKDAGNTAFDPREYIDALTDAGYRPAVFRNRDGSMGFIIHFPDKAPTEAEEGAYLDACRKYGEASTARERVVNECLLRGLIDGIDPIVDK